MPTGNCFSQGKALEEEVTDWLASFRPSKHQSPAGTQKLWEGVRNLSLAVITVHAMQDWQGSKLNEAEETGSSVWPNLPSLHRAAAKGKTNSAIPDAASFTGRRAISFPHRWRESPPHDAPVQAVQSGASRRLLK